jgi:hypothetical protein
MKNINENPVQSQQTLLLAICLMLVGCNLTIKFFVHNSGNVYPTLYPNLFSKAEGVAVVRNENENILFLPNRNMNYPLQPAEYVPVKNRMSKKSSHPTSLDKS